MFDLPLLRLLFLLKVFHLELLLLLELPVEILVLCTKCLYLTDSVLVKNRTIKIHLSLCTFLQFLHFRLLQFLCQSLYLVLKILHFFCRHFNLLSRVHGFVFDFSGPYPKPFELSLAILIGLGKLSKFGGKYFGFLCKVVNCLFVHDGILFEIFIFALE